MAELLLALPFLAYFLFALTNSTDKYLVNKGLHPQSIGAVKFLLTSAMLLAAIGYFAPSSFFVISMPEWTVLLIIAALGASASFFYFRALKKQEITHFIPYYQSAIVLIPFILSIIFLAEIVNFFNVLGAIVIVAGIYITASRHFQWPRYAKEVHIATIFNATQSFFLKVSALTVYPLVVSLAPYFVAGVALLFYSKRRSAEFRRFLEPKILAYIVPAALASFLGTAALLFALSLMEGSKVFPVSGIYLIFVMLFGGLFLKEQSMKQKAIGAILIVLGIYAVYL